MFIGSAFHLLFGVLTVSFVLVAVTGIVLVLVFLRREANLSELQADFVSKVSHELRTPLTSIRLFAETMLRTRGDQATQDKCLDGLGRETERLVQRHRAAARLGAHGGRAQALRAAPRDGGEPRRRRGRGVRPGAGPAPGARLRGARRSRPADVPGRRGGHGRRDRQPAQQRPQVRRDAARRAPARVPRASGRRRRGERQRRRDSARSSTAASSRSSTGSTTASRASARAAAWASRSSSTSCARTGAGCGSRAREAWGRRFASSCPPLLPGPRRRSPR